MLLSEKQKRRKNQQPRQVRRGIYILPNLLTTANLFCGFYGIIAAIKNDFKTAAIAILVSCLFDILDGKVARFTGADSRFGLEYDSLADMVAFGLGPALLVYLWALAPFGRLGWVAAFLFVACGALRLARFNVQVSSVSKRYFVGLPIPGAACMVATTVLFFHQLQGSGPSKPYLLLTLTYILGFLMVSNIPYSSFKEIDWFQKMPFRSLVLTILLFSIIAVQPSIMLFTLMLVYVGSGPVGYARRKLKVRKHPRPGEGTSQELFSTEKRTEER
jgi:CDP-diacylglycerol--serine O-phosphatidyltransferase